MKIQSTDPRYQHLYRQLQWSEIDFPYVSQLIRMASDEDLEAAGLRLLPRLPGDATTYLFDTPINGATIVTARQDMVVCGLPLIPLVLEVYGNKNVRFDAFVKDGDRVSKGTHLCELSGNVSVILKAERVLLNFLQHLTGVATQTARYVSALGNSPTRLLDTRKTTPGFRALEKYAVACGGGWNHRMGLYDRIMLKDNHLSVCNANVEISLIRLVEFARKKHPDLLVEIEVDALTQIPLALEADADVILLDNFSVENLVKAIAQIGDRAHTEASGGITLTNLAELGQIGLDFISSGALIHQSVWVDIGLDWK